MGLVRFFPTKDTFICNRALKGPYNRVTGSNLGGNPTLQVSKVTSSYPTAPAELARSLLQFDYRQMSGMVYDDRSIPQSGVSWVLKMFNYVVGDTTPKSYDLNVCAVSSTWDEGDGQDDKTYQDYGFANWMGGVSTINWLSGGGDYLSAFSGTQHFDIGDEDLEVDVTSIVQGWLTGTIPPQGLMVKLSDACENNLLDYWRKVFYSRDTHIVEKIPFLEARWDDVRKDNRGNFAFNQPNALYLYNFVRGTLRDVSGAPTVRLQDNWLATSASFQQTYNTTRQETGVYSAAITITSSNPSAFSASWVDIWQDGNGMCLLSGNLFPLIITGSQVDPYNNFVVDAVGLKRVYRVEESARIVVNVRRNYYNDHLAIHTASLDSTREYMEDMYYSVVNNENGEVVIPFGTGSVPYTKLSYNRDGNYFQLAMSSFVPGFTYRLLFMIQYNKYEKDIIDDRHIFKVI
jgi:hypothetical protein